MNWTAPYHGVSHLETGRGASRPQYTIEEYERFTDAVCFLPGCGFGSQNPSKTFYGPGATEQAKKWLESLAKTYE